MDEPRTHATVLLDLDIPWAIDAASIKQRIQDALIEWSTIVSAGAKIEVQIEKSKPKAKR